MNKLTKVLIGILILVIGLNIGLFVLNFKKEIKANDLVLQTMIDTKFGLLETEIKLLKIENKIEDYILNKKIDTTPNKIKLDKFLLERKLQKVNENIINSTVGASGSGVTIKYRGKYYILSAGHMLNSPEDKLVLVENDKVICDLEVIKYVFTMSDDEMGTKGIDLLLLKPKNKYFTPKVYVELADYELPTGSEIYIVGNPLGIEDVISDGRIIAYEDNYLLFIDHSYFGNSGGGIYTKEGKLLGINSFIGAEQPMPTIPPYLIGGAVRLSQIQLFLAGVTE